MPHEVYPPSTTLIAMIVFSFIEHMAFVYTPPPLGLAFNFLKRHSSFLGCNHRFCIFWSGADCGSQLGYRQRSWTYITHRDVLRVSVESTLPRFNRVRATPHLQSCDNRKIVGVYSVSTLHKCTIAVTNHYLESLTNTRGESTCLKSLKFPSL
jgi:hypothetical protein